MKIIRDAVCGGGILQKGLAVGGCHGRCAFSVTPSALCLPPYAFRLNPSLLTLNQTILPALSKRANSGTLVPQQSARLFRRCVV
jgi:hypothetical protein